MEKSSQKKHLIKLEQNTLQAIEILQGIKQTTLGKLYINSSTTSKVLDLHQEVYRSSHCNSSHGKPTHADVTNCILNILLSIRKKFFGKILVTSKLINRIVCLHKKNIKLIAEEGCKPCDAINKSNQNSIPYLFDLNFYLKNNPELEKDTPIETWNYYNNITWKEVNKKAHPLFDSEWYLKHNSDLTSLTTSPLNHFVKLGWREGRNPHPLFNTKWYLAQNPDIAQANIDPFEHFIKIGWQEKREPHPNFNLNVHKELIKSQDANLFNINPLISYMEALKRKHGFINLNDDRHLFSLFTEYRNKKLSINRQIKTATAISCFFHNHIKISIIIPVYNAAGELDDCLKAVLNNTSKCYEIIIVDDCSPDQAVKSTIDKYSSHYDQIKAYRNTSNQGFSRTVNRGIRLAENSDVILLNSDTQVTPRWVENLRLAAYSENRVGTVTPLSNNAGAFSAPVFGVKNDIPEGFSIKEYGRLVSQNSQRLYPEAPTGNGFCMYIKRSCILDIGEFDHTAFPRGYGEENDFCMKALHKGWKHLIDDGTIIYHVRSASFGDEKNPLMKQGRSVLDTRYPEYQDLVIKFVKSSAFLKSLENVSSSINNQTLSHRKVRPRILFVISTSTGGTPQTNNDLMLALLDYIDPMLLHSNSRNITLSQVNESGSVILENYKLQTELEAFSHRNSEYDYVVSEWLVRYSIELTHIRHIAWHSLGLIDICSHLNIPIVFSFHDYYTICPTVTLLDNHSKFCSGNCTNSSGDCSQPLWKNSNLPHLKHKAIHLWRSMFKNALKQCHHFITTSEDTRSRIETYFSDIVSGKFSVIPHGRNFEKMYQLGECPDKGEAIRIVFPGNISVSKGADLIKKLANEPLPFEIEIHIVGKFDLLIDKTLNKLVFHGAYTRDNLSSILEKIRPHIGGVFSIWSETYCHTLTELWSCGIPVMAFDIGAVGDRVRANGGGWLINEFHLEDIIEQLNSIKNDSATYYDKIAQISNWQKQTISSGTCEVMAQSYLAIYKNWMVGLS